MNCKICAESNVGPEHEITEKHIKNKVLYEYTLKSKHFAGNRKGVVVSCSVKSSVSTIEDFVDARIKVSVKPEEQIQFKFTVENICKNDDISVLYIQMAHSELNFVMNDHGLEFGCYPVIIKPKKALQREVSITFKCSDIGQYEVPVIFSFRKPEDNEGFLIMRDVVVYVEQRQTKHETVVSPYTQKEVKALKLLKTTMADQSGDKFRVPKNYKPIFAKGLKLEENAPEDQMELCKDLKEIFKTGVTEDNYVCFFHNLLWYEETIVRINLKKYNMSNVPLRPKGDNEKQTQKKQPLKDISYELYVPGLAEKRPSLMLGDLLFVRPYENEAVMFEGVITEISAENMITISGLDLMFAEHFNTQARFDVRFFMSRMPMERMHCAVQALVKGAPEQSRVFPRAGSAVAPAEIHRFYNSLVEQNPEQRGAVERIVANTAGSAPFLLHGPPGTGKTITIVEAILQLVAKDPENRILVCTESNMAADHVASLLAQYAHLFKDNLLLRASSRFRVWESLPENLRKFSNGHSRRTFERISINNFMSYNIVVTTLSHAAKFASEARSKNKRPVSHLFIDEAAQASEPACLIPVAGLLAPQGAMTLAGDPLQLGPVVISHHASKLGLGLSLMERLSSNPLYAASSASGAYTLMLRNNFRSDPAVLILPNDLFYHGQVRALAAEDPISKMDILGKQADSRAIVFHGVLSKEQKMGKSPSFFNHMELEIVSMYLDALVEHHRVLPTDIGVVTPYARQVYKVKKWLDSRSWGGGVEVGTVESFQGKEKRVILVSTVRANCGLLHHDAKFQLGFLVDDKRFNVALTRAKAKVIIVGNPLCLSLDSKWRAYMQKCREFGTYFGYDDQEIDQTRKEIVDRITPLLKDLKI